MKKYYVFDNSGKYLSQDGKTRFSLLQGKALKAFFNSDRCIGKRFMKLKSENPSDDEIYIELRPEHIKAYRVAERREQYISDMEDEYCPDDVLSLDVQLSDSDDDLTLADVIADPEADVEANFAKQIDIEILRKALKTLKEGEMTIITALYLSDSPISERELAITLNLPQKTLNNRKLAIFRKLKKFF